MVTVVGSDGFIGSKVASKLRELGAAHLEVFFEDPSCGHLSFGEFLESDTIRKTSVLIITAGNSNHNLARDHFQKAFDRDTNYLFKLDSYTWKAHLVFLSSAAVYYGWEGEVDESAQPEPTDYYGLSKLYSEYLVKLLAKKRNSRLVIFRLTNAFGRNPKRRRLFDNVLECLKNGEELKILGDGGSYINPIKVEKVAEILVKTAVNIERFHFEQSEIVNLGSIEHVRVLDIAKFLEKNFGLKWVTKGHEIAPVKFKTVTKKLRKLSDLLDIKLRNVYEEIEEFILENLEK